MTVFRGRKDMWERVMCFLVLPLLVFVGIQLTRGRLVGVYIQWGFPIPHEYAFLSLAEPPPEYPIYRLGTLYRVMHDLTLPYLTVTYLLSCLAVFAVLGIRKRKLGFPVLLFVELIHLAYLALYFVAFTVLGPVHIDGVLLPAESEPSAPAAVSESIEGG